MARRVIAGMTTPPPPTNEQVAYTEARDRFLVLVESYRRYTDVVAETGVQCSEDLIRHIVRFLVFAEVLDQDDVPVANYWSSGEALIYLSGCFPSLKPDAEKHSTYGRLLLYALALVDFCKRHVDRLENLAVKSRRGQHGSKT